MQEIKADGIYTVREVAEMFGLSERSVKKLVYDGRLPARKIARRLVFVGAELLQALPAWSSSRKK